jgi:L-amino acid N-acyltransferase YncA
MLIRPAVESDVPAILVIYNQVIATSTAIYNDNPVTLDDRLAWFRARAAAGYPVLVAVEPSAGSPTETVVGFSTFGDFRHGYGYRFTVELSVHVDAAHRGRGIGRQLVEALIPIARSLGKHALIGGVDATNTVSIRLHQSLGFHQAGHFKEVGYKFNRWLDLILFQLIL